MPDPVTAVRRAIRPPEVRLEEYPCSDGRVLMETEPHANSIVAMRNQLQWHFEARPDVYVSGSMALYWRQGDPSAVVAPDVFVALGVEKRSRKSYRVWDEGGVMPAFVVEVASASTSRRDATGKRATYEGMGVREYWRFDPLGRRIREGLEGWPVRAGAGGRGNWLLPERGAGAGTAGGGMAAAIPGPAPEAELADAFGDELGLAGGRAKGRGRGSSASERRAGA